MNRNGLRTLTARASAGLTLTTSLLLTVVLLSGCSTSIKTIQENPSGYAGRMVNVSGTIDRIFPLPVGDFRIGIISDDTAAIPILLRGDYRVGDAVRLRSEVVAFSADGIRASRDEFESRIAAAVGMLGGDGEDLARRVMNLLIPLAETFEVTYLLIER